MRRAALTQTFGLLAWLFSTLIIAALHLRHHRDDHHHVGTSIVWHTHDTGHSHPHPGDRSKKTPSHEGSGFAHLGATTFAAGHLFVLPPRFDRVRILVPPVPTPLSPDQRHIRSFDAQAPPAC